MLTSLVDSSSSHFHLKCQQSIAKLLQLQAAAVPSCHGRQWISTKIQEGGESKVGGGPFFCVALELWF